LCFRAFGLRWLARSDNPFQSQIREGRGLARRGKDFDAHLRAKGHLNVPQNDRQCRRADFCLRPKAFPAQAQVVLTANLNLPNVDAVRINAQGDGLRVRLQQRDFGRTSGVPTSKDQPIRRAALCPRRARQPAQ